MEHTYIFKDPLTEADYIDRHFFHKLTSKLFANRMEHSVMYWHFSLGLFTIQEFGRLQVLGFMLRIPSQWVSMN